MAIGQIPWTKGKGAAYRFLLAHVDYDGESCLPWPFCRDKHGRGMLGVNGEHHWAHRLMCKMANGEPPTPKHTAAHNCGKGHEGCIHPKHLEWKTQKANMADCAIHGTQPKHFDGPQGRITDAQADQIRGFRSIKTQGELAAMFEVSEGTINDIWRGRTHAKPSKINHYSAEDDAKIRQAVEFGMSYRDMAEFVGRPQSGLFGRARRLGLKSKWSRSASADPANIDSAYSNGERT
jgi:hypothetical protein